MALQRGVGQSLANVAGYPVEVGWLVEILAGREMKLSLNLFQRLIELAIIPVNNLPMKKFTGERPP